jgi:hypothetical protein
MPELSAWADQFASARSLVGTLARYPVPGGVLNGSRNRTRKPGYRLGKPQTRTRFSQADRSGLGNVRGSNRKVAAVAGPEKARRPSRNVTGQVPSVRGAILPVRWADAAMMHYRRRLLSPVDGGWVSQGLWWRAGEGIKGR